MNADLLILGQRHFADDEHRLTVLSAQGHVVHAEVYVAWIPNANVLRGCGRIERMGKFGSAPRTNQSQKHSLEKATTNLGHIESSKSPNALRFLLLSDLYVRSFRKVGVSASEEYMSQVRGNWLNAGNTQVLINHKLLFECIKIQETSGKVRFVYVQTSGVKMFVFYVHTRLLESSSSKAWTVLDW